MPAAVFGNREPDTIVAEAANDTTVSVAYAIMNGYGTTVFFVELQLNNYEQTPSFLLPF